MSAGGLSYSGLRTHAKATLPSVEMWGTNLNILKDPPKSIHTRRIDKVGQTQSVLNAQDESGDRIAEAINVYARGVNPMVAVSFDNYSNNAGRSSPFQNKANASLPYKVRTFRPPVQRQEDLLPLSRLPRNWFYSYTNPSFPGVVQAAQCNEVGRSVHDTITHTRASTNPSLPAAHQTYLSTEYSGKGVNEDKKGVIAVTNKSSRAATTAPGFDQLSAGKVGNAILLDVSSQRSMPGVAAQTSTSTPAEDLKQVRRNKKVYEAFSQKSVDRATGLVFDKTDTNKQVRADPLRGDATTNLSTRERFVHTDADVSTIPVKDYLYSSARAQATAVFRPPVAGTPDNSPKPLLEEPLRVRVAGTKRLRGGAQATDASSTSAIPIKPFLYHSAEAPRSAPSTRDGLVSGVPTHSVQEEPLLASAATTRSFIASKGAFDDTTTYEIYNAKRTPVHSVQTNTQTPYAMYLEPGVLAEPKRSRPLMEAATAKDDAALLRASRDAYEVQSRNGSKKTHPLLPKGGFEGQGSAVPVFNQYENYNYSIDDPVRQDVRQRAAAMMEGRYESAPVFS